MLLINWVWNVVDVVDWVATFDFKVDKQFLVSSIQRRLWDHIFHESKENLSLPKDSILTLKLDVDVKLIHW